MTAGIGRAAGLEREFGFELNATDGPCGRFASGDAAGVARVDHGDDFVCRCRHLLSRLCQLLVGDGLAVMGQQAFDAAVHSGIPIARSVSRKVNETATAVAGAFAKFANFLEDVGFGGLLIPDQADLVRRNTHGHGNAFRAFDVIRNALQRRGTRVGAVLTQSDHQSGAQSRLRL